MLLKESHSTHLKSRKSGQSKCEIKVDATDYYILKRTREKPKDLFHLVHSTIERESKMVDLVPF